MVGGAAPHGQPQGYQKRFVFLTFGVLVANPRDVGEPFKY